MRKFFFLCAILSALSLSVPTDLSFANTQTKKHVVQGKAKQVKKKSLATNKGSKKTLVKGKSNTKKVVYKRPRYASNVNQPKEGELLKLEGMIKDLNEQ
ncbi:MAG: hypothetical protein WKI46_07235 [Aquificaceae bacterium]